MNYTQLTQEQRYQIQALLKMEHSRTEIADTLGVHRSTISRELQRNRGKRGYRPKQAHEFALQRRKKARKRITTDIWALVEAKLRQDWSPEQIAGRFKEEGITISHEHLSIHLCRQASWWRFMEASSLPEETAETCWKLRSQGTKVVDLVPDGLTLPYPSFDLSWTLYRKIDSTP